MSERNIIMVKNNRTNEEDLRQGLAEKARLTAEETSRERVLEREEEDREGTNRQTGHNSQSREPLKRSNAGLLSP